MDAPDEVERPARVLFGFQGDPAANKLKLRAGELVTVLDPVPGEWWWARGADGSEGYLPAKYVDVLDSLPEKRSSLEMDRRNLRMYGGMQMGDKSGSGQFSMKDIQNFSVEGWLLLWDDKTEKRFYYCPATNTYTWDKPSGPAELTPIMKLAVPPPSAEDGKEAEAEEKELRSPAENTSVPKALSVQEFLNTAKGEGDIGPVGISPARGHARNKSASSMAPSAAKHSRAKSSAFVPPPKPGTPHRPKSANFVPPPKPKAFSPSAAPRSSPTGTRPSAPKPPPATNTTAGNGSPTSSAGVQITPPAAPRPPPQRTSKTMSPGGSGSRPVSASRSSLGTSPAHLRARRSSASHPSPPNTPPAPPPVPGSARPPPLMSNTGKITQPPPPPGGGARSRGPTEVNQAPPQPRDSIESPPPVPPGRPSGSARFLPLGGANVSLSPGGSLSTPPPPSPVKAPVQRALAASFSLDEHEKARPSASSETGVETAIGDKIFLDAGEKESPDKLRQRQEQAAKMRELESSLEPYEWEKYVEDHFFRHRKGVVGSSQSVPELASFSAKPWKKPVLKNSDSALIKQFQIFRKVMEYMGDAGNNTQDFATLQILLEIGERYTNLNNEIFATIIKQVQSNPSEESSVLGWELICACACAFMPTEPLLPYLRAICAKHRFESSAIGALAFRTWQRILPTENPIPSCHLNVEQLKEVEKSFVPGKIFGVPLEGVLRKEFIEANPFAPTVVNDFSQEACVPRIVQLLSQCVYLLNGLKAQGIFRVAADADSVSYFRAELESGDYGVLEHTVEVNLKPPRDPPLFGAYSALREPNEPADLLKYWLRKLEPPLIDYPFYDEAITAAKAGDLEAAKRVFNKLPPAHRATLRYLCTFLNEIAKLRETNMMDSHNIALVIAPNVLRNPSNDALLFARNADYEKRFLILLIDACETL